MLADLVLQDLPDEVLVALKDATTGELNRRHASVLQHLHTKFGNTAQQPTDDEFSTEPFGLPPEIRRMGIAKRLAYLPYLLGQDWTSCFTGVVETEQSCYVYAHLDPRRSCLTLPGLNIALDGQPFYIGKGAGNRAWDLRRNQGHGKRLQALQAVGYADKAIVRIIAQDLSERKALELEAKLIYFFGSIYDDGTNGCLLNLADHVKPLFVRDVLSFPLAPGQPRQRKAYLPWQQSADVSQWNHWQNTSVAQKYLPEDARAMGYTVIRIDPPARPAFLALVPFLTMYASLASRTKAPAPEDLHKSLQAWQTLTRRLVAYMKRLLAGQDGTNPLGPF